MKRFGNRLCFKKPQVKLKLDVCVHSMIQYKPAFCCLMFLSLSCSLPLFLLRSLSLSLTDTWVSLPPTWVRPLWFWTYGRHNISTAATSTSWPPSWPTSANRRPWYSSSPTESANPEDEEEKSWSEGKNRRQKQQQQLDNNCTTTVSATVEE